MIQHKILVLGGYGFFGSRICLALASDPTITLLIAGRNIAKAQELASALKLNPAQVVCIDARAANLTDIFLSLDIDTVIHTAGPFQGQDYAVARAAISAGANYIDLADGREFVAGISKLDNEARQRGVLVTSGASSLPALSSAVVDRYASRFSRITAIHTGIASGARAPGLATMRGIFGYCGKPFTRLESRHWKTVYGWLDLQRHQFPDPVGYRLLGSCDVPDLILFPYRYQGIETVTFHAGFASNIGHLVVWGASLLVRAGLMSSLSPLVVPLNTISKWMERTVSDKGGMFVSMQGDDADGNSLQLKWHLIAAQNHGPHIPCGAAIALAKKLANSGELPRGAMPCMGLLTVEEYLGALHGYDIQEIPA